MTSAARTPSDERPLVTIVGLGPAGPEYWTEAARDALSLPGPCFVRTARHPSAAGLIERGAIGLDDCYERAGTFDEAYASIVEAVIEGAQRAGHACYGVPGSTAVLEETVQRLRADLRVATVCVPGMSFLDLAFDRLAIDPVHAGVRLLDAAAFAVLGADDAGPFLLCQAWSKAVLSDVKLALEVPPSAPAVLLYHLGLDDEVVAPVAWSELDRTLEPDHLTTCFVPVLAAPIGAEVARANDVVRTLRTKCPWDAAQTHRSLVRHLVEETYEAIEAIEALEDPPTPVQVAHLQEELGDVLCQVLFHATIAAESGQFNLADVAAGLADKLVFRHPHVYGEEGADHRTAEDVLSGWEERKREEKGRTSLLDGIPLGLPALALAAKLERRTGPVGHDAMARDELGAALDALATGDGTRAGELLFAIARITANLGLDPETCCREAARQFRGRFSAMESLAARNGDAVASLTPEARDVLWAATAPR